MAVIENMRVRKRDRSNENFKKKWGTLKNNGLIIHQVYDAEVYVCIRRKGEKYEFKSTDKALPFLSTNVFSSKRTRDLSGEG
ncbi:hypothetical protein DER44DRAFT_783729 [Fusarium oxysporum]|nr:hypothetical protein DER44DRAFT_783729 [Fusarium oxysporum]